MSEPTPERTPLYPADTDRILYIHYWPGEPPLKLDDIAVCGAPVRFHADPHAQQVFCPTCALLAPLDQSLDTNTR